MRTIFTTGLLIVLITMSYHCRPASEKIEHRLPSSTKSTLTGKTIAYRYGESVYHVTIDTDSTLHWKALTGEEKGIKEYESYKMHILGDQTVFITWGEANGTGVSQVLDFETGTVYNHLLRGRSVDIGMGEIEILD